MEDSHACVLFWSIICWNYALDIIIKAGMIIAFMLNLHCLQHSVHLYRYQFIMQWWRLPSRTRCTVFVGSPCCFSCLIRYIICKLQLSFPSILFESKTDMCMGTVCYAFQLDVTISWKELLSRLEKCWEKSKLNGLNYSSISS